MKSNILHRLLKDKSQNYQRIVTALLLVTLFFGCLWGGKIPFLSLLGVTFILSLKEWEGMLKKTSSLLAWRIGGALYITLGFLGMGMIALYNPFLLIMILLLIWATDTGAYFVGRALGGPKLAPRISPSKTWTGMVGGMMLCVTIGCLLTLSQGYALSARLIGGFILISLISIGGDLLESFVKRRLGVKDSGTLLPGHGGILDRLDSPLAVGVTVFFIVLLV